MESVTTVTLDQKRYTWDGTKWYGTDDYIKPPLAIIPQLHALIEAQVTAEDAVISDQYELFIRAKAAATSGQRQRAEKLARKAYEQNPSNSGRAAAFCSILRQIGSSEQALGIADLHKNDGYAPILTSRSAALCDLERWDEAFRQIRQVLAIKENDEPALLVLSRIKSKAPQLFDES